VIHVSHRPYVHVRFVPHKLFLSHCLVSSV
jgi:hypothetical protein